MTPSWIKDHRRSGKGAQNVRWYKSARSKAMVRLAQRHPEEFQALFEEERAKLPPPHELGYARPRKPTAEEELREMYGI